MDLELAKGLIKACQSKEDAEFYKVIKCEALEIPLNDNIINFNANKDESLMIITGNFKEILRFEHNGEIYLHGKLIDTDKQVVDGFKEFLDTGVVPKK